MTLLLDWGLKFAAAFIVAYYAVDMARSLRRIAVALETEYEDLPDPDDDGGEPIPDVVAEKLRQQFRKAA